MKYSRRELIALAVHTACVLVFGIATLALIEAAPAGWFTIFGVLGPTLKPWLMGAAALISIFPTLVLAAFVVKALRLPLPRE